MISLFLFSGFGLFCLNLIVLVAKESYFMVF